MNNLNIIYMGTPDFSVLPLKELYKKYNILAVVTQPDKEVGRKKEIKFSPVKEFALEKGIKVLQPNNIKKEYQDIISLNPDIIITCAYGQIIPKELLDYPKYKCINIHASLLPKLRGGAPIHKAIITGEEKTGITIMFMDEKMDSGDILYQKEIPILDEDDAGTLFDKLSTLGSKMIVDFLPKYLNNDYKSIKQNESDATFAYNITREEEKIDFNKTSKEVFNQIRGLNPWPVGYAIFSDKKLKIFKAEIGSSKKLGNPGDIINIYKDKIGIKTLDGEILLTEVQLEGKKRMNAQSFLNGFKDKDSLININLNH